MTAKRYRGERDEEHRWSDKMASERNEAIHKCIELEKLSVDKVFADWERIEDVSGVYYDYCLEKDSMRIIIEDGKAVGWLKYEKPVAEVLEGSES